MGKRMQRRDMLRGLGALAIATPPLAAAACGGKSPAGMNSAGGLGGGGATVSGPNMPSTNGSAGTTSSSAAVAPSTSASAGKGGATSGAAGTGAGAGGSAPGPTGGAAGNAGTGAGAAGTKGSAGTSGTTVTPAMFDDAASCTLTTTDIEGPFFIDDNEVPNDESLIRSDIREGHPGVEFRLSFRLLDAKNKCAPIPNSEMYIWHCDADGYYSGFNGQDPSKPYTGSANPAPMNLDRFCRGVQTSDSNGVVTFTTIYPGWYAGRPIHIHLIARFMGATNRMITTQLYFPAAFTTDVHTTEPAYMARAASIPDGSRNPPAGNPAMPTLKHTPGLVVGTLNVIVNRG